MFGIFIIKGNFGERHTQGEDQMRMNIEIRILQKSRNNKPPSS